MWVSVGVIFGLILAPLAYLYVKWGVGLAEHAPALTLNKGLPWPFVPAVDQDALKTAHRQLTWGELIWAHTFVSVYMGWVCVACIANVSIALTPKNDVMGSWLGLSASGWSIMMQTVAALLAVYVLATRLDAAFAAPIAWALIAIAKQQEQPGWPGDDSVVSTARGLGWTLVGLASVAALYRVWLWRSGVTSFASTYSSSSAECDEQSLDNGSGTAGGGGDSMTAPLHASASHA